MNVIKILCTKTSLNRNSLRREFILVTFLSYNNFNIPLINVDILIMYWHCAVCHLRLTKLYASVVNVL